MPKNKVIPKHNNKNKNITSKKHGMQRSTGVKRNGEKSFVRKPSFKKKTDNNRVNQVAKTQSDRKTFLDKQRAEAQAEKEKRRTASKNKRLEKTKIISKKTKKGQPLMKDRINLLLKQIQESKK